MPRPKKPDDFKVLIAYPNLPLMLMPSIAVALFTRIFRNKGYQVDLFETTYYVSHQESTSEARVNLLQARKFNITEEIEITIKDDMLGDFRRKVEDFKPDFMIFSVVEDVFNQTVEMLKAVEDLNVPHLIGGVFPTNAPERCMDFPEVRMVGLGEGETTVATVAEAVRQGKSLQGIPGTWYRDDSGEIHRNLQPKLVDINEVVPDFGLFDPKRFMRPMGGRMFRMAPVESYRGCPYDCTYCNSPAVRIFAKDAGLGNFLRRKMISGFRDELADLCEKIAPEFLYFVDDSFLARPQKEIYDFCDMYEEFKIPFWFNTRAENFDPALLQRLEEVGCYRMAASVECGNEEYRIKVLRRKISNEKIIKQFGIVADSGIAFSIDIIIGMPGETRELIMDTVELIHAIRGYDALTASIFTPYHGTTLRKVAVDNGWFDSQTICDQGHSRSLLEMPAPMVNADEIDGLVAVFPLYCYFPKSEWKAIRRAETPDEEGLKIREHYSAIYQKEFLGENQDHDRVWHVEGGTGCRTNPKDAFRVYTRPLNENEIDRLVVPVR